jgi:hypothetical protein
MSVKQFSTCGIPYAVYDDGRVSVRDNFPNFTNESIRKRIEKIWNDYGSTIILVSNKYKIPYSWLVGIIYIESGGNPNVKSPCNESLCPALWKKGLCKDQGGPESFCAGGLMQFISATARGFGKTIDHYLADPHDMIWDAANLIVVGGPTGRAYSGGVRGQHGDICSVVKQYNGGSRCGGGGITGHGGQADYVSKFIRTCNTFVELNLVKITPLSEANIGLPIAAIALGGLGYAIADSRWDLTDKILGIFK